MLGAIRQPCCTKGIEIPCSRGLHQSHQLPVMIDGLEAKHQVSWSGASCSRASVTLKCFLKQDSHP